MEHLAEKCNVTLILVNSESINAYVLLKWMSRVNYMTSSCEPCTFESNIQQAKRVRRHSAQDECGIQTCGQSICAFAGLGIQDRVFVEANN